MDLATALMLAALIGLLAALYSAVGHGGASGYLAAMALLGVAPESMRPTALALNVIVASLALLRFYRPATFAWSSFGYLAIASVPCAWIGGMILLPATLYQPLIALVLVIAAWQLFVRAKRHGALATSVGAVGVAAPLDPPARLPVPVALVAGGAIGALAGLTGVGGAIFLSPLLVLGGWFNARDAAPIAAAFVLVNSLAGLGGHAASLHAVPAWIGVWAPIAAAGAMLGATAGSRRLDSPTLLRVLAAVLILAAVKFALG